MKNGFWAIAISSILILSVIIPSSSFADKPSDAGKPDFVVSVEKIKEPKSVKLSDGRIAEKVVHIFYKEGYNHKPDHAKGPPSDKGNKGGGGEKCYTLLAKGAKWKSVEDYRVDQSFSGLPEGDALAGLQDGITSWEDEITSNTDVFGSGVVNTVDRASIGNSLNGQNEVMFNPISESSTIAVTISWGIFSGNPNQRELVEWDMIYNTQYDWGNAGPTDENNLGDTSIMDYLNIATHELGHAAGLSHPADTCLDETMYSFATEGETKKRTLNAGDIDGINDLY